MLKTFCTLLFSMTLTLFSINNVQAQCSSGPPCEPDCPQTPFGPYQTIQLTIQPGCVLEVTYASRIACGIYRDYYIAGIQIIQFSGCPFSASDVNTILDLATIALMDANPAGFPPLSGPACDTQWRAGKGACWEQNGDCLVPCTPTDCCLTAFEVCVDAAGNKTITELGNISGPPTPCPVGQSGNQCIDVCN